MRLLILEQRQHLLALHVKHGVDAHRPVAVRHGGRVLAVIHARRLEIFFFFFFALGYIG